MFSRPHDKLKIGFKPINRIKILSLEQRSATSIKRVPILCRHTNSVEKRGEKKIVIPLCDDLRFRTFFNLHTFAFILKILTHSQ